MYISFSIEGSFVTKLAREKLYQEHNLNAALDVLTNSLQSDQLTPNQTLMLALQILNYDADIVGTYPGDDYGIKFKDDVDPDKCDMQTIISLFDRMRTHNETTDDMYHDILEKYLFVCEHLTNYELTDINAEYYNETGECLFPDIKIPAWKTAKYNNDTISDNMLTSFIEQRHREDNADTENDYGWLDPDGNFYPVEWSQHYEWARDYLDKHYPFKEHASLYWYNDENNVRNHITAGDVLIYNLHWALLDNPYRGLANLQYNVSYGLTKAQKEFLYDYFIERNRHAEANALYKE